jgi:hypothetical protein
MDLASGISCKMSKNFARILWVENHIYLFKDSDIGL